MGVQIIGADRAKARLEAVARRVTDPRPALEALAAVAQQMIAAAFASSRSPAGSAWAPRRDPGDGHPLLVQTGRLQASARAAVAGLSIVLEDAVPYAGFLARGYPTRSGARHLREVATMRRHGVGITRRQAGAMARAEGATFVRGRPFLPLVSRRGRPTPLRGGDAGAWWESFGRVVARYVSEGRVR